MLADLTPGFVESVDRARREVRVSAPPHTDGATEWPIAEMCYPIGDDSPNTEIRLVAKAPVWLAFRGGDARYPIIMGHRPVNTGNEVGTRRWNHDNFELNADQNFTINAGAKIELVVGGARFTVTPELIAALAAQIALN